VTSVLGVDGGQSAIRLRHSSGDRIVEVPGVSRLAGDQVAAVADAIASGWHDGGFQPADRVVMGLTTAPVDAAPSDRLCGLVAAATGAVEVWLADDAVTSHAGALSLGWGISVVAGTGVACLAVPDGGQARLVGGHGFLLGDEGGGFWIGREGVRAVLRHADGRGPATELTDAARQRFGALEDLHIRLHESDRPVDAIARFAPDVLAAARAGDPIAGGILDEASRELVLVARAGAAWVIVDEGLAPLGLGGRLLEPASELRQRVEERLAREQVPVAARTADASALEGAIELGRSGMPATYAGLIRIWKAGPSV